MAHKIIIGPQVEVPYVNEILDEFIYSELTLENPVYRENAKMNRWNGNTPKHLYYYEVKDDRLFVPRGFSSYIINFCQLRNIPISLEYQTESHPQTNWVFAGELREFQRLAIADLLPKRDGTLCSPTGSGKTIMGLYLIAARKQPAIILVHTKELLFQWIDRIETFLEIPKSDVGIIGDGQFKPKEITVALVQTLKKHVDVLSRFGYMIADECHRVPSKTFHDIIAQFPGPYITGLSATPYRNDGLGKLIEWYAGPIRHSIFPRNLINTGHIVGIEPIIRNTNFRSLLPSPKDEYAKLLSEIVKDDQRNNMIVEDIVREVDEGETCLILTDRKKHCQILYDMIPSWYTKSILTGNVSPSRRKEIVQKVNSNKIQILIATGQLIGEGFDCSNLSVLFLTVPIKYAGRVIQYLGRVLRPKPGKNKARIYDYFDQNIVCLYGSHKSRIKVYKTLT